MDNETLTAILEGIREQDYPLNINADAADALVECIRRIMALVPEDERVFVRADYDLATTALCHPEGEEPRTNDRWPRSAGH